MFYDEFGIEVFPYVYDARTVADGDIQVRQIAPSALVMGSVVLVEARSKRYKVETQNEHVGSQPGWPAWRTFLDLKSMTVLQ